MLISTLATFALLGAPSEAAAWARAHAVPLSLDAEPPSDGLGAVAAALQGADVVLIGEPTHGTRESWTLRRQLLAGLASRNRLSGVALEAGFAEAMAAEEYAQGGALSAEEAAQRTAGIQWPLRARGFVQLLRWVRAYNGKATRKIHVYGIDAPSPGAARLVRAALEQRNPLLASRARPLLDQLGSTAQMTGLLGQPAAPGEREIMADLQRELAGSPDSRALQAARILDQTLRFLHQPTYEARYRFRDEEILAANVRWALQDAGGPLAVLAHDGHITMDPENRSMGARLRRDLGERTAAVGIAFGSGGFLAMPVPRAPGERVRAFDLAPPAGDLVEAPLGEVPLAAAAFDLRAAPHTPAMQSWLDEPRPLRAIGAIFKADNERGFYLTLRARRAFDWLLYIQRATPEELVPAWGGAFLVARYAPLGCALALAALAAVWLVARRRRRSS